MKIIFFGNSDFSVESFRKLIQNVTVLALVTAPDSVVGRGQKNNRINPVKELALEHNIPVLQPEKLRNNMKFHEQLKNFNADLHVIVSYGKIIPKDMISIPRYETINLHASLLPNLRGAAPIQYALWQGLEKTGNTVQFITEKMDKGDIIGQNTIDIGSNDRYAELEIKLSHTGAELLLHCVQNIRSAMRVEQDHNNATYTKLITKEDGAVYFSMTAQDIVNAYRAFHVRPGIYSPLAIGDLKILDCSLSSIEASGQEGEIIAIDDDGIHVKCYEGVILLKKLQLPTKKSLHAKDFCNGNRLKQHSVLK